jgi:ribonuclease D
MSNWAIRPLSKAQQQYAALDALVAIDIYNHLRRSIATLEGQFDVQQFVTTE